MKTKVLYLSLLMSILFACETKERENKIDRKSVVDRYKVIATENMPASPAQVGNGEFAIGVDITGLQTFEDHYTMSQWSWHSFPLPEGVKVEDFQGKMWDTYGRPVRYDDYNEDQPELSTWLAGNPHRFNLGKIGLRLLKADGTPAVLSDLENTRQEIDLWTGIITSTFIFEGTPVQVKTLCHGEKDVVAVAIESELLSKGQLKVSFSFPYPDRSEQVKYLFDQPGAHTTRIIRSTSNSAHLERTMDDTNYFVSVSWDNNAQFDTESIHQYQLSPAGENNKLQFVCSFTPEENPDKQVPGFEDCLVSSRTTWKDYWMSGAAIDLSESTDPRWEELERRIILSQYLMKVNEAGSWPPQESGLVNNAWYGRFHFEMIWWHGVHYALWDRWPLFDRSLHVFPDFLDTSIERADRQGYRGARWPKCTADLDRDWPHHIHATLIWQQPHPIYFAELDYRLHPSPETLEKWRDIVFQSADFMADFAHYDAANDRYVLGPPVYIVSENTDPTITINPTFELGYWRFGLRMAQEWRERLGLPPVKEWEEVLKKLSPLPVEEGVYVTYEGIPDMWTNYTWEHPGLTGVYGMLPGDGVDTQTFAQTLDTVFEKWDFNHTWGWDFPMMAMAAARIGKPEKALDMLLHPAGGFQFDIHGLATGGPFPYFPSNGALLTAVAMMTAGWDGSEGDTPGFPKNGKWIIKHEGFKSMP